MNEKKKKRILIFSLAYPPFIGGAEIAIKEITDRISDISFDLVTLRLDSNTPAFEKVGNVSVYRVGFAKRAPSMKDLVSFPWYLMKVLYPLLACAKARALHREKEEDESFYDIFIKKDSSEAIEMEPIFGLADIVIENTGTLEDLEKQVLDLFIEKTKLF